MRARSSLMRPVLSIERRKRRNATSTGSFSLGVTVVNAFLGGEFAQWSVLARVLCEDLPYGASTEARVQPLLGPVSCIDDGVFARIEAGEVAA